MHLTPPQRRSTRPLQPRPVHAAYINPHSVLNHRPLAVLPQHISELVPHRVVTLSSITMRLTIPGLMAAAMLGAVAQGAC